MMNIVVSLEPSLEFRAACPFSEGRAVVSKDKKWGILRNTSYRKPG